MYCKIIFEVSCSPISSLSIFKVNSGTSKLLTVTMPLLLESSLVVADGTLNIFPENPN